MIGTPFTLVHDGETVHGKVTALAVVETEEQFGQGAPDLFLEAKSLSALWYMAWRSDPAVSDEYPADDVLAFKAWCKGLEAFTAGE